MKKLLALFERLVVAQEALAVSAWEENERQRAKFLLEADEKAARIQQQSLSITNPGGNYL